MDDSTADILFPDRPVPLETGEEVTVREFRFLESLRAAKIARPIIDDLAALFRAADDPADVPYLDVLGVFAAHPEALITLLEMATGRTDIADVSTEDGYRLIDALWGANQRFFVEMVKMATLTSDPSASDTSSPFSSEPDTAGTSFPATP